MRGFGDIVEDIRRKPYDLLDASKTVFDRDFLERCRKLISLFTTVQHFSLLAQVPHPPAAPVQHAPSLNFV